MQVRVMQMTASELERMRDLPDLIRHARSSSRKLRLARELHMLTAQYRRESEQVLARRREAQHTLVAAGP